MCLIYCAQLVRQWNAKSQLYRRVRWNTRYLKCIIATSAYSRIKKLGRPLQAGAQRGEMAAGARSKFGAPHVRTWDLSEANMLYWRKYFWHWWDFSTPPAVIRRPGNCAPLAPSLRPWVPGARSKFGAPMFEPEVFRKQMCSIEVAHLWHI